MQRNTQEANEDEHLIRNSKTASKKSGVYDIETPISESSDPFQVDTLLQNFDPKEFLAPPSLKDTMYVRLLNLKANLPMYITIFIIYGIGVVYLLTFLLPILIPEYNEYFKFIEEESGGFGLYTKNPSAVHWVFLFGPY